MSSLVAANHSFMKSVAFILSVLGATACAVTTATPPPIPDSFVPHDCRWSADVLAWVDTNANGTRDTGEEPLRGVKFFYTGGTFQEQPVITNLKGEALLTEFMPGCPYRVFEIRPEVPTGFKSTTAHAITSYGPNYPSHPKYEFGFAPLR